MSDQNNQNKNPDEIEADIEETRTQLGDDVEAITYQLSPERYREQLRERTSGVQDAVSQGLTGAFDDAGVRSQRATKGFLARLEDDPLPAVLVALGVGVLAVGGAFGGRSSTERTGSAYPTERMPEGHPYAGREAEYLRNSPNGPDYGRTIGDAPNAGALSGNQDLPAGGVDDYDYAGPGPAFDEEAYEQARREAYEAKRGLARLVGDHPVVVGGIITLVGIAAGLSVPSTRREDALMGRESDVFKRKAERTAQEVQDVAVRSYQNAKETVKDEADNQDLNEGRESFRDAGTKAKRVAEEATKDARKTAQSEAEKRKSKR